MVKTVNTYLHNKFVFEVRDAATNELKQEATAYNIVLDNMYERLCTRSSFFTYIQVGTGNGELDAERKTLFTWGIGKSATVHETEVDYPTSYVTKRIILNPEDLVGETLTEVGIGYASQGSLVTHAKLQDAAGAPLAINKTSLDVVIVYATVYFTFSLPEGVALSGLYSDIAAISSSSNVLVRYLLGGTWSSSVSIYCGAAAAPVTKKMITTDGHSESLGTALSSAVVSDVDNKKLVLSTVRAATTNFNYNIKELIFSKLFSISIPNSGYAGTQYNSVPIATGDGESTEFILPSYNIRESSLTIYVAGTSAAVTIATHKLLTQGARTVPTAEGGYTYDLNGAYFFKVKDTFFHITNYVSSSNLNRVWFTREIQQGTALATEYMLNPPVELKTDYNSYYVKVSGLAIHAPSISSVNLYSLDHNGFNFIETRDIITDIPYTSVRYCDMTPDKKILAILGSGTQTYQDGKYWISLYKYDTDEDAYIFERMLLSTSVSTALSGVSLSETGRWLAYYDSNLCVLHICERIGDSYSSSKLVTGLPAFSANTLRYTDRHNLLFSPDDTLLFIKPYGSTSDDFDTALFVLKFDETTDTWTAQDLPDMLLSSTSFRYTVSPDSKSCVVYNYSSGAWRIYTLDSAGKFKRVEYMPHIANKLNACPCRMLSGGTLINLAKEQTSGTYLDNNNWQTTITFDEPPEDGAPITADYFVEGIHKTDQYVLDVRLEIQFGELT